ncbi:recombinase family protein [Streptomyces sp. 21So2-11]|uniref:recombinase family protein n=1 Tax=Streptomyces sp. 21So2-11 TaxID=3144408 RepID=UPI00321C0C59
MLEECSDGPQRTFYGTQFGNTFPLFVHFGVPLWVPEIGGAIDPENEAHDLVMSVFGGMSKGERNRIKIRVRTAMASQAKIEGRFLGGRPPYGYRIADAGPHPHPAKAADGKRLHALEPDPETAPVVTRIFTEYLRGKGHYAIAEGLTRDAIPCPSAHDRARNSHRAGHAWSKGAVRAILANPRYTGHQVWNKQRKEEVLLDINDVTLGHRTKLTWNPLDKWVWSLHPVHTALISPETFTKAQAQRATRNTTLATRERSPRTTDRPYPLRGLLRCGICRRKMQGNYNNGHPHYRCRYPAEYAKSATLDHPLTVYVRQDSVLPLLDAWIARIFAPGRLGQTLRDLHQAQQPPETEAPAAHQEPARSTVTACERRISQYRAALDAGADPALVSTWINQAQAEQAAARQQLAAAGRATRDVLTEPQIHDMIKALGDMSDRLQAAEPERKAALYADFGIQLVYNAKTRAVTVESQPAPTMCVIACPRGDLNPHAR